MGAPGRGAGGEWAQCPLHLLGCPGRTEPRRPCRFSSSPKASDVSRFFEAVAHAVAELFTAVPRPWLPCGSHEGKLRSRFTPRSRSGHLESRPEFLNKSARCWRSVPPEESAGGGPNASRRGRALRPQPSGSCRRRRSCCSGSGRCPSMISCVPLC